MDLLMWVVVISLVSPSLAKDYTVGGSQQWENKVNYTAWASGKTFTVGDKLIFKYTSAHSVLQVKKADYDACQTSNALKTDTGGSTTVALSSAGNWYFICGTPGHCSGGMKLAVDVKATTSATPSPPSGTSPSPSPRSSSTPPTEPSAKSPAGNNSAATSAAVNGFLALTGAATVAVLLM